jgi:diguanylate cyclase (GGDEF)-like protein
MASGQTRGHEGFVVVGKIRPQVRRPDGPRRYPDIECRSTLNAQLQTVTGKLLTQVLGQSEHIHALIEQSVEELSSANTGIKHELAHCDPLPGVKSALEKNDAITRKLHDASERLAAVNEALRIGIRDRAMVDHQLAAAVEQEEGSRSAALHDALTGLPNRVLFKDRLEHGIAQAKRHRWILAVMFVDLDNFKSINDTYGHPAGDAVLNAVATRLALNTRREDTVSRYGGDEFLYLLTPLHEQKDIAMIAAKVLLAIRAPCGVPVGDVIVSLCIEASIGISVFPKDGATAAALIQRADDAMYGAKEKRIGFAFAQ